MSIERHFWGWDQPVLSRAVQWLAQGYTGGELDLSTTLLIVPTGEAGRRLKQALAQHTATLGGAAVVPHVWAPERALMNDADRENAASATMAQFAWMRVLQGADFAAMSALFPKPPERVDWSWASSTARMLMDLQTTLGAGGYDFALASQHPATARDRERWQQLAALESSFFQALQRVDRADAQSLKAARAAAPWLPDGVTRVLVLAAPDLPPLLGPWLETVQTRVSVTVCVHAPEALSHAFDALGKPTPSFWQRPDALAGAVPVAQLHLAKDAPKQADLAVERIAMLAPTGRTAVGVCDPELIATLNESLALAGVRVFEPDGVPVTTQGLWHVFGLVRDLVATRSWRSFAALLRVEEARTLLAGRGEGTGTTLLRAADDFAAEHLPITVDHALELVTEDTPTLQASLQAARSVAQDFERKPLLDGLRDLLLRLHGERVFAPHSPADRATLELADLVLDAATEVDADALRFQLTPSAAERLAFVLERVSNQRLTTPRGEVDLVLQGWLELLWESAPCLIIAGMNEEHVPGILVSHPFLPDSLREALGLPSQASRYARDAYTLHALAAQRRAGDLHVLCGQWSGRGDAMRPSRLLFRGPDAELPQRVARLFPKDDEESTASDPPRSLAWRLQPRSVGYEVKRVSASLLRSYLICPFRFYLSQVLGMSAIDPNKQEMADNEFGTLIHTVFQRLAEDKTMAVSTDEAAIAAFLCEHAEREAHRAYGRRLPMLVRLQLESALQRLRAAATHEAASRRDGWRIMHAELILDGELTISGVPFRGKVDRVEQRERGGRAEIRVLDFKTGDRAKSPIEAHFKAISARTKVDNTPDWQRFEVTDANDTPIAGKWLDLQLPLYAAAMSARGLGEVSVGYFNLPKNVQDTGIELWPDFHPGWSTAAVQCAEAIVARLTAQEFWPPSHVAFDDYAELFLGDVEGTVGWGSSAVQCFSGPVVH